MDGSAPTRFWKCNPYFCDGKHATLTPEKLEEYLKKFMSTTRDGLVFTLMIHRDYAEEQFILPYLKALVEIGPHATRKALRALELFRSRVQAVIREDTFAQSLQHTTKLAKVYFSTWGAVSEAWRKKFNSNGSNCLGALSEADFINAISRMPPQVFLSNYLESGSCGKYYQAMRLGGWSSDAIRSVHDGIIEELRSDSVRKLLSATATYRWFKFLEDNMLASRIFQWTEVFNILTGVEENWNNVHETISSNLKLFWESEILGLTSVMREALEIKTLGDKYARQKKLNLAILQYSYLNNVGSPSTQLINSLNNSAALRLRLSKTNSNQLPMAIIECTFVLQIDAQNVKALFRRGLALALCEKWNEAIFDFERALELDPNSPAKKELEVARRRVMRETGN